MYRQIHVRRPGVEGFAFMEAIEQAILAPIPILWLLQGRKDRRLRGVGCGYTRLHHGSDAVELLADQREQAEPLTCRPFVGASMELLPYLCAANGKGNQADPDRDCGRLEAAENQSCPR